jgi:hypothetical protein
MREGDVDMTETAELQNGQQPSAEIPASARTLLRVVYIMGIILVLLFLLLIGGIIWKATNRTQPPSAEAPPPVTDLGLPPGTSVQSMLLDGDRLAVNTGSEVFVIDIRKNVILARVRAAAQ